MRKSVYNIFCNFFKEENVDLRDSNIIVHFPKVTVTNEYDKSHDITELWVKINVKTDGTINGTFQMIRSEFTTAEIAAGYSHSHIPSIYSRNVHQWGNPCLGYGPIRDTINSLAAEYSEEMWQLFCLELSRYVATESIEGGPYVRMEIIYNKSYNTYPISDLIRPSDTTDNIEIDGFDMIEGFMYYILNKRPFKFNYTNGSYGIAATPEELLLTLSNLYIEWYNSLPIEFRPSKSSMSTILFKGIKTEIGKIVYINNTVGMLDSDYQDRVILTFKGKDIHLNVIETTKDDENTILLLTHLVVSLIVNRILRIVNTKYGKADFASNRKTLRFL